MRAGKTRVAILFGGRSGEHEVSLASARSVINALDPSRYEIYPVGITHSGRWITTGDPMALLEAGDEAAIQELLSSDPPLPSGRRELVPSIPRGTFPEIDVVFPVLHGTFGEDGTVQGLLELADLPYVGAGVLGSALGMDKVVQKMLLAHHGVPIVDYVMLLRSRWDREPQACIAEIENRFRYPVFIKPANLGSSVGVSKAHNREELEQGLALAARYDRKILVERAVNAREIECSVLGNDEPVASLPGEVVPSNEFYDYHAKYIDGRSELHIPADLSPKLTEQVRELAICAFQAIDCSGMARVDFFLCRDTGQLYVNELNTIPGFTEISMYPKLWEASGLPYPQLLDRLIELAIERYREKQRSETVYRFDH